MIENIENAKYKPKKTRPMPSKAAANKIGNGDTKKNCCPGQQYVPKKVHNESKFAGESK